MTTAPRPAAPAAKDMADSTDTGTYWPVAIGLAAQRAGVSARMLRHYEALGLLPPVARTDSGYRQYAEADVHALRFIRRARDLGFSLADIAELLALWRDQRRASADVKRIALEHVVALERKIAELQGMASTLRTLAAHCHGDARPDCPILTDLDGAGRSHERSG